MTQFKNYFTSTLFFSLLSILIFATLPSRQTNSIFKPTAFEKTKETVDSTEISTADKILIKKHLHKKIHFISKSKLLSNIAKEESKGAYDVANKDLFLGKYQAGRSALIEFGYSNDFINSIFETVDTTFTKEGHARYSFNVSLFPPTEQERFIRWFLNHMETDYLKIAIEEYVGKKINGVYITKAGILYASMLGFGNVKNYLETNGRHNFTASHRNSIKSRLKKYEKFEIKSSI